MSHSSTVSLHQLSFEWPDGSIALQSIDGAFGNGTTGLIGNNGSGKSTLLKLIAGILQPTSGRIDCNGEVGYLPQTLTLGSHTTVAELLGIHQTLAAIRAIESGDVDQAHFDQIGDDWDIEARADEALHQIGFSAADLHRSVAELSGGESMLIAIVGLKIRRTAITLLDEPTNNLDRATRAKLAQFIDDWPGTLIIVSHDLELLDRMQHTAELHAGRLESFGGPYSEWKAHREAEQAAAEQAATTAKQALKAEKRQRAEAEVKLARRERTAKKTQRDGGIPKIIAGMRANSAQVAAGSLRSTMEGKVQAAQAALDEADSRVREESKINLTLPDPGVPRSRKIAELRDGDQQIIVQGPERVALIGANGSGKSTLLTQMLRGSEPEPGRPHGRLLAEHIGYLPQRLDGLDESASAVKNVQAVAAGTPEATIRNQLARLLLRGSSVDRAVNTLSGGERFRVSIAKLLLADPAPQLLLLDEPTNNLDMSSVEQLAQALDAYKGALIVVSHDFAFLSRIGIDTVVELDGGMRRLGELPK